MSQSMKKSTKYQSRVLDTAEAFYRVFCALPKKDRLTIAQYILYDEEIQQSLNMGEIPSEVTIRAFKEDKSKMPVFENIDELRKDLLS